MYTVYLQDIAVIYILINAIIVRRPIFRVIID